MGAPFIFVIGAWVIMAIPGLILETLANILLLPVDFFSDLFGKEE